MQCPPRPFLGSPVGLAGNLVPRGAIDSRVAFLETGGIAPLLIPVLAMIVWIMLPAFGPGISIFLVLLLGVVASGAATVVGGYPTGSGWSPCMSDARLAVATRGVSAVAFATGPAAMPEDLGV